MDYQFRKGASSGSWCSMLLPFCLLSSTINSNLGTYRLFFSICILLAIYCFVKQIIWNNKVYTFQATHLFHIVPASLAVWWLSSYNILFSYMLCIVDCLCYSLLISTFLTNCPWTFTLGEVQIIAQGITLFMLCSILSIFTEFHISTWIPDVNTSVESVKFLEILFLGFLSFTCLLYVFQPLRSGTVFFLTGITIASIMVIVWSIRLRKNPFLWLLYFCFKNNSRVYLLLFWLALTFASIIFVTYMKQRLTGKSLIMSRKYFHFIINAVFIPGVIYDIELLGLASGIALTIFILLEICRILNVSIIGPAIDNAFKVFLDEKDSGILIVTHIYLLLGCCAPVWLSAYIKGKGYHICALSGIISVGFGDTAAALGGSFIGRHHWKGSKKTIEGTICAIVVQLCCSAFFLYLGHDFSLNSILLITISVLMTSYLEAKTTQIDNLVLPLFMFSFLSWIR